MTVCSYEQLRTAVSALDEPPTAFVLGSGLGPLTERITQICSVNFADLPGLVAPTVSGHGGALTLGHWVGRPVLILCGRLHYYEGHAWNRVVRPMEILAELGVRVVVLTNASGGIRAEFSPGCLMALTDHMEWNCPNWWREHEKPASPYDALLLENMSDGSHRTNITLHKGVYAAVTGPCYETPAEVRAMKALGADAAGMSTAREARRAKELGMRVAAVSCIANHAAGISPSPLCHQEVLTAVSASAEKLGRLFEEFLRLR
jgi:purine-nucleoside phosphorylase